MGRIGASLSGIERTLLNQLAESNAAVALSALRISTGRRINAPSDDPFGFITLSAFRTQLKVVGATASNIAAASSTISKAQLTLDQIRTQLNLIRTNAVADEEGALTQTQRDANQAAVDAAVAEINRLATSDVDGRRVLDGSADFGTSGANSNQISGIEVYRTGGATVTSPATAAALTYTGVGGLITADATVILTGREGSTQVSLTTADSLATAAQKINDQQHHSGVVASASGDTLTIRSVETGKAARLEIEVPSGTFNVTGGNGNGVAFGTSGTVAHAPQIGGQVVTAATAAQLVYTGTGGQIDSGNATFTLAGARGEVSISVTAGEDLTDVADAVNAQSHKTGITAAAGGDSLTFTSIDFGSAAGIAVVATTGTFAVGGGNGDGTADGTDAVVEINGRTLRGPRDPLAATLTYFEASGQASYNSTIRITGKLGSADITINQTDTLDAIRTAIDAETVSTGVEAVLSGDGKTLTLQSTDVGGSASLDVKVLSGTFIIDGGNGDGTAAGSDAILAGAVRGNQVNFYDKGLHARLELTAGFTGTLDAVTITDDDVLDYALSTDPAVRSRLAVRGLQAVRLGGTSGTLDQLLTGGSAAGLGSNASLAIRIVDEALGDLERIDARVTGFFNSTVTSSAQLMDDFQSNIEDAIDEIDQVDTTEEALLQAKNQQLAENTIAALAILNQQRTSLVGLVQQIAGLA